MGYQWCGGGVVRGGGWPTINLAQSLIDNLWLLFKCELVLKGSDSIQFAAQTTLIPNPILYRLTWYGCIWPTTAPFVGVFVSVRYSVFCGTNLICECVGISYGFQGIRHANYSSRPFWSACLYILFIGWKTLSGHFREETRTFPARYIAATNYTTILRTPCHPIIRKLCSLAQVCPLTI